VNANAAPQILWGAVLLVFLIVAVVALTSKSRRRRAPGAGASGAIYDLLNEDKRNAIEMIVEERAEAREPEDAEGDLEAHQRNSNARRPR
jgi:hypothetical protein